MTKIGDEEKVDIYKDTPLRYLGKHFYIEN